MIILIIIIYILLIGVRFSDKVNRVLDRPLGNEWSLRRRWLRWQPLRIRRVLDEWRGNERILYVVVRIGRVVEEVEDQQEEGDG